MMSSTPIKITLLVVCSATCFGQTKAIQGQISYSYTQKLVGVSEHYELLFNEEGSVYIKDQKSKEFKSPQGYNVTLNSDYYKWYLERKSSKVIELQNLAEVTLAHAKYNATPILWEIKNEKKNILGYPVQKAVAKKHPWRNHGFLDAVAWFAADLPINSGPERFWGLPGIILELGFSESNHLFVADKIIFRSINSIKPNQGVEVTKENLYKKAKSEKSWFELTEDAVTKKVN